MMKNRIISFALAFFMLMGILPVNLVEAANDNDKNNNEYIQKMIDYVNFSESFNETYKVPNKKKINNQENVATNSVIQIKFNEKLDRDKLDFSKIKLKSNDGDSFVLDKNDIWITHDDQSNLGYRNKFGGKILNIDLNSENRSGKYSLRKDTLYKLILEKGSVSQNSVKQKKDIEINFLTGRKSVNLTQGLGVNGYSSDNQNIDDITRLNRTELSRKNSSIGRDGSIYIHLSENVRWNTGRLSGTINNTSGKNELDKKDLKHFKFYEVPKAYEEDEDGKPLQFRYNENKNVNFESNNTKMKELEISSAEIISVNNERNIIKITPKNKLNFYNMYYLKLDDKEIITDIYGRKLKDNIDKYIWTAREKKNPEETPKWKMDKDSNDPYEDYDDQVTAEEIIKNENSPDNKSVVYRLYGVPKYNEYINDLEKGKPIIINVDGEVIPNPNGYPNKMYPNIYRSSIYKESTLDGVKFIEEHGVDDKNKKKNVPIKWYQLKYFKGEDDKTKTKIYLYPKGELDSGKSYNLSIDKETFVNREAQSLDKNLKLEFNIEGERSKSRGIDSVTDDAISVDVKDRSFKGYVGEDRNLNLTINGFNFTEDIRAIRFKNVITGKEIKFYDSSSSKFEFINVDELKLKLSKSKVKELLTKGNGGEYEVYIDFGSGKAAGPVGEGKNTIVIYERPYVLETNPKKDDWNVNKNDLYIGSIGNKSGNYLTVVFDNINGQLKKNDIKADRFEFYENLKENDKLIDTTRDIEYEGFKEVRDIREYEIKTSGIKQKEINNDYGTAKLYIDDDKYKVGEDIKITLFDHDLNLNTNLEDETKVIVTIGGEEKETILEETSNNSGKFEGNIKAWKSNSEQEDKNDVRITYVKRQSADGEVYRQIVQEAKIVDVIDHKRRAQVYIEKELYYENEEIKITVIDKEAKKPVKVKINLSDNSKEIILFEKGTNTGVFERRITLEKEFSLENILGEFTVSYSYKEEDTVGESGKAKIYIPITNNIENDTVYKASIPEGIVYYGDKDSEKYDGLKNKEYEWSFKTSKGIIEPNVDGSFVGSAPQDYDENFNITLKGGNFDKNTIKVYLRDMSGKKHEVKVSKSESDNKTLYIYFPTGSNRLSTGLYDILVENEGYTGQVIEYGVFSIVPRGDYKPNEDFNQTDNDSNGDVIEEGSLKKYIKTSNDTLELKKEYINSSNLNLNLDEIMGENVWSRNIGYEGKKGSTINKLIMDSKWSNITLSGVTLDSNSSNNNILIRTGRTAPAVIDNIKKKIRSNSVKSEFIEVGGNNYKADKLNLSIPYTQSNGRDLKLLKYDEDTRRITEVKLTDKNINNVDKRINVELTNALPSDNVTRGIFVVVE